MKKSIVWCLSVLMCLCSICSCSANKSTLVLDQDISLNYNNIGNYPRIWLANDKLCYLEDMLVQSFVVVDKDGKDRIALNDGYGSGKIQAYDNSIYMLYLSKQIDEHNEEYELKIYDYDSKKTIKKYRLNNCENFLVLNGEIYYLEYAWANCNQTLSLKKLTDDNSNDVIANDVLSFGVIEEKLFYITKNTDSIIISSYNSNSDSTEICGEFPIVSSIANAYDNFVKVSFTSKYVLFSCVNYETGKSTVYKYSIPNSTLTHVVVDGYIEEFVAYNMYSYLIVSDEHGSTSELYKLDNDTNELFSIAKIHGTGSLFVGSDDGAYVLEHGKHVLKYYCNDGKSTIVYEY